MTARNRTATAPLSRTTRRTALLLLCVMLLGLVSGAGCTVRTRGQYEVGAGTTSR